MDADGVPRRAPLVVDVPDDSSEDDTPARIKINDKGEEEYDYSFGEDEDPIGDNMWLEHRKKQVADSNGSEHDPFDWMKWRKKSQQMKSTFVQERMQEYLDVDLRGYKLPTKLTDPIELEPLSGAADTMLCPVKKPLFLEVQDKNGNLYRAKRIVGYREIFKKRQRRDLLRELTKDCIRRLLPETRASDTEKEDPDESNLRDENVRPVPWRCSSEIIDETAHQGEADGEDGTKQVIDNRVAGDDEDKESVTKTNELFENGQGSHALSDSDTDEEQETVQNAGRIMKRIFTNREIFTTRHVSHLLREEGKVRNLRRVMRATRRPVRVEVGQDGDGWNVIQEDDDFDDYYSVDGASDVSAETFSLFHQPDLTRQRNKNKPEAKEDEKPDDQKKKDKDLKKSDKDVKKSKESNSKESGAKKTESSKTHDTSKPKKSGDGGKGKESTTSRRKTTIDEAEKAAILLRNELLEKDEEWFKLSESDEEQAVLKDAKDTFAKEKLPWMSPDISYESQMMLRHTRVFNIILLLFGRQTIRSVPPLPKDPNRHVTFAMKSVFRQIPFIATSLTLWVITANLLISLFLVYSNKSDTGKSAYDEFEIGELDKYLNGFIMVVAQNIVISVWSATVIYRDGEFICQYMSCQSHALTDMETSGVKGILCFIVTNMFMIAAYGLTLGLCYSNDTPKFVRRTCGLIGLMTFRSYYPRLGFISEIYEYAKLFGLLVQIYTLFCFRAIMMSMQINAKILQNAAQMWNFKFGLHFSQFAFMGRGHLYRLKLNASLVKIFKQHRYLYCLTKLFGGAYNIPILMYFLLQTSLALLILVNMFFYEAETSDTKFYQDDEKQDTNLEKPRSQAEFISQALVVLVLSLGDFIYTTRPIAFAANTIMDGFEFVRRQGQVVCAGSHERRLIQSLQWSFSGTNPALIRTTFDVSPPTIFGTLAAILMLYSLIIQIQSGAGGKNILRTFPCAGNPNATCALLLKIKTQ